MKLPIYLISLALAVMSAVGQAVAGSAADAVTIDGPYARAVPPGQPNSASFMAITNNSDKDHALVAAESDVSNAVELHTHIHKDGMMMMRQVEKLDLPAGKTTKLQPGGHHVMLIGLKEALKPGEEVDITLVFEDGSKHQIKAPVKKLQMKMSGMKHDKMQGMDHGEMKEAKQEGMKEMKHEGMKEMKHEMKH